MSSRGPEVVDAASEGESQPEKEEPEPEMEAESGPPDTNQTEKGGPAAGGATTTPENCVDVHVLSASGLAKMDRNGKADPYVVLTCGKTKAQKSKVMSETLSPVWSDAQFTCTFDT